MEDPQILKSDYETASEFDPDFDSDIEPPSDKVYEERMVLKNKEIRVYKRIIKLGKKIDMPSKYDKIRYKFKKFSEENLSPEALDQEEFKESQMGISEELDSTMIQCIQFMKKGELSSFRVEHIQYDKSKHQRNLKAQDYFQFHLSEWETIIDTFGDFKVMKHVIFRGVGQKRFSGNDEAVVDIEILNKKTGDQLQLIKIEEPKVLKGLIPKFIFELLCTLKDKEMTNFDIKQSYIESPKFDDTPEYIKNVLNKSDKDKNDENEDYLIEVKVNLKQAITIEDLFEDEKVLKRTLEQSYSTSRPDIHSRVYFCYSIFDKNGNTLYNGLKNEVETTRMNELNFEFYEDSKCEKHFLDNYSISKALRKGLREAKKLERFTMVVSDPKRAKDGSDIKNAKKGLQDGASLLDCFPLKYEVIVYTFSMGDSGYSMGKTEKERFYLDRKQVVTKLLKTQEYKRALKVLTYLKTTLENGTEDEDKPYLLEYRRSVLLNTSLCHWKLGKWTEMKNNLATFLEEIDSKNTKAWYRMFIALEKLTEYEKISKEIESLKAKIPDLMEKCPEIQKIEQRNIRNIKKTTDNKRKMFSGLKLS